MQTKIKAKTCGNNRDNQNNYPMDPHALMPFQVAKILKPAP